jgi:thiol-disulfide isomerase/thioredoxin
MKPFSARGAALLFAAVIVTMIGAWSGTGIVRAAAPEPGAAESGAAPALYALSLPDANNAPHALSVYRGRPLVVNFWASWCAPCVREMPDLSALHQQYEARGIGLIGIAVDSAANVQAFARTVAVRYPLLVAGFSGSDIARRFGDTQGVLPFTVVLDRDGRVRYAKLGVVSIDALRRTLDTL